MDFISQTWERLWALMPGLDDWVVGVPAGVVLAVIGLAAVSRLSALGIRTPDTRKLFHAWIFSSAGALQLWRGVETVSAFGATVACLVLYTVWRGDDYGPYEALARPTDAPRRSLFIVVPMVMTALGGVLSNLLFPGTAAIGYWVAGWGDAVGEPVGVRWGKHRYDVPSLGGVPAQRSLEGSAAVFLASLVTATIGLVMVAGLPWTTAVGYGALVALAAAAVEAVSNHGTDNLTIQVAAAGVAWVLLRGT